MRAARARPSRTAIVKLNEGVAGRGNALVDLREPAGARRARRAGRAAPARASAMAFEHPDTALDAYLAQLAQDGGIVEERVAGAESAARACSCGSRRSARSSCSRRTTSCWAARAARRYLGCRFPADFGYARAITREAAKIGAAARRRRACSAASRSTSSSCADAAARWTPYAIELNLRKGGTTHPFLTLQFLTDGRYDPATALFTAPSGREKHLVATDHLESDRPARPHASTTCSTSSSGTGCTSTRRARPASCST